MRKVLTLDEIKELRKSLAKASHVMGFDYDDTKTNNDLYMLYELFEKIAYGLEDNIVIEVSA